MSTTLEAETSTAAEEAAAAIEAENQAALEAHAAELERRAAAGDFAQSAGITDEQEAGEAAPLTQAEREAAAEHDGGGTPDDGKRTRKKRTPGNAQGNLAGGWEQLIGGAEPTESKVKIASAAIQPTNAPEKILKGTRHRVLVDLVATGYASNDKLDHATGEISSTTETRTLKIVGAQFLDPEDYIARADDGTDVAAEADADEHA